VAARDGGPVVLRPVRATPCFIWLAYKLVEGREHQVAAGLPLKLESPTCRPPGIRKRDCTFLTYLQTGYLTATYSEWPLKSSAQHILTYVHSPPRRLQGLPDQSSPNL